MNMPHIFFDRLFRRRFALLILLCTIVLGSSQTTFSANQVASPTDTLQMISKPKNVLILFSYHRAEWSDNVQKGIESVFAPYQNVHFFYEFMDTKRLKTEEYLETLRKIYIEKYTEVHIDLVLCVDNNALDLLVKNPDSLFPGTPVVFCGINDYRPALHAGRPDVTGVVEHGDFADTLKITFEARPNATKLYIICDQTETGVINTKELLATLSTLAPSIQVVLTDRMSYKELAGTLQNADPQQAAFFVSFWKDGTGLNIEPWQLDILFRQSTIPVFGRSEWMINHGMVGGKCVTGFSQGEKASKLALQVLDGKPASTLPVDTNSPNQYLYDYQMMKHYLINENIFPDTSIGFNRPEPFFLVPRAVGATLLVFSLLLLAAFAFLVANIQQRRKAEKALRESESRYRGMIENIQDTFYRTDAQGILIFVSTSGARLLGYDSPQEMIGKPNASFWYSPEDRQKMLELMKQDGAVHDYEVVLVRKDGVSVPVSTTSGYYYDKDSQVLGVEGIFRDITERKEAEATLLAERRYLTDIIDSLPDPTFIIDTEKRIVVWNKAIEKITKVKREDLLGQGDYAYSVPFYGQRRPILIDLVSISEKEMESEYSTVTRSDDRIYAETFIQSLNDGKGAYLWGVAAPLYDRSGVPIGAIEVIKDITELKKSEKNNIHLQEQLLQSQKIESIGRLAGGVAHDFNNMLGVILGHAELAQLRLEKSMPLYHNLEEIRKAAQRSADLTRQLLAFARKQTIIPEIIDLNKTVDGMLAMLRRLIGEDINLVWLPGKDLGLVNMDPSQLDQILANLFVNARDAIADTGTVTIETAGVVFDEAYCKTHNDYVPGEYILLTVSDNGCGMSSETIAHLFEPFFTTKEMGKGTGLGLAMIHGIIKQNEGFINVYSEPGLGTTFKIYLPRHTDGTAAMPRRNGTDVTEHGNESILLVEDEPMILDMTATMLELQGYTVLSAKTPGAAVRLAEDHAGAIHLLMTDVVMPEMNGRELARNLLSLYPGLKCLFMSGYTANVIAHHGVLDDGVHFIQKPFDLKDLAAKIRNVLDADIG